MTTLRLDSVLDSLELGVIILNARGEVVRWNDWMFRMSGKTRAAVEGSLLTAVFPGLGSSRFVRAYLAVLETGLPELLSQALNRSPLPLYADTRAKAEDKRIAQAITIRPLKLDEARGCVIQIQDVSAAVEREAMLRNKTREAEAAKESQRDFLAKMSHELRTPMNGILALTELVLSETKDPEKASLLKTVHVSALSLLAILNDLLDFSKIEAGKMELESIPTDLRSVLHDVQAILRPKADPEKVRFTIDLDDTVPSLVFGDPLRIRQILLNLTSNALKFTPHGEVTVHASLRVSTHTQFPEVVFSVRDSGIGIEDVSRLFRDFVQGDSGTSRRFGGTGLGLAISRRLAALMNGDIEVESEVGRGSEFRLVLPARIAQTSTAPTESGPSVNSLKGRTALVVDDNPTNLLVLQKLLERLGIVTLVASDGSSGVALALSRDFDFILMDCHMPGMDGLEATRLIRQKLPSVPIVAVTASALEEDRIACKLAGMDDFLSKPVNSKALSSALKALLPRSSEFPKTARSSAVS